MKITESTSISLKLLLPLIGASIAFGSWMHSIDNSVATLKTRTKAMKEKMSDISSDVKAIRAHVDGLVGETNDEEKEANCIGLRCYGITEK